MLDKIKRLLLKYEIGEMMSNTVRLCWRVGLDWFLHLIQRTIVEIKIIFDKFTLNLEP